MFAAGHPDFTYIETAPGSIGVFNRNITSYQLVTAYSYANITIPIDFDIEYMPYYNGMLATGNTTYVPFGPAPFSIVVTFICSAFTCSVLSPYTIDVKQGN
jgi:hypothetical protein